MDTPEVTKLLSAAKQLGKEAGKLTFSLPVAVVYNTLDYAWEGHALYLKKYGAPRKKVIFLGMNPGPWGMVQTGVPFGEVDAVQHWLGIEAPIGKPRIEHPKRPVTGFNCKRSEVSGKRLWGLFRERFGTADAFFNDYFVANYCPLAFMETEGRNRTPDKLTPAEALPLFALCDRHLAQTVAILEPEWLIGVGRFTEMSARRALQGTPVKIGHILHPSPLNPTANRRWAETVTTQLEALGIW
ncbi:MAG: uracil-DNA glycosylase family protein [Candidatus Omnitrophota bacterium]